VVGDFVDNYKLGYPSELGVVLLLDPRTGAPKAILDGAGITDMRTGAMTAVGAKYLARKNAKVLGHIGARGSAYWNVRLLDHLFDFDEIRVHSKRPESREAFGARLAEDLGKKIIVADDWRSCVEGADIVVEASRLSEPQPLLKTEWIKPAAFIVPYGTMSAVELSLTDIADKLVVDDWGQCKGGPFGSLRAHVNAGKLSEQTLHAEMGQIVAARRGAGCGSRRFAVRDGDGRCRHRGARLGAAEQVRKSTSQRGPLLPVTHADPPVSPLDSRSSSRRIISPASAR